MPQYSIKIEIQERYTDSQNISAIILNHLYHPNQIEEWFNAEIKNNDFIHKFFGPIKNKVSDVFATFEQSEFPGKWFVNITAKTQRTLSKEHKAELLAQLTFLINSYLRPSMHKNRIPNTPENEYFELLFVNDYISTSQIYQRNKYLEDLNLTTDRYGTNYCTAADTKHDQWRKEKLVYGFDNRETWNMDLTMVEWLYSHLKMYFEVSIVDVDYMHYDIHIIDDDGNVKTMNMTMREIGTYIMDACKQFLLTPDDMAEEYYKSMKEMRKAMHMWAEACFFFGW